MIMKPILIFIISVFLVGASLTSFAWNINSKADLKTMYFKPDSINYCKNTVPAKDSLARALKQKALKDLICIGSDWPIGKIVLRDGLVIENYFLRYNLLKDQLEYISGKDTLVYSNPQNINTAAFGGHTFVYANYTSENIIRQVYFELLVAGKNKLLVRRFVTSRKPDLKYPDDETLTKFKINECYYISKSGMPAHELKINRKSVLSYLDGHNEDISEYLRITENKVRTIEDLKNLVSYYNSLDEEY
jgi:hypothetical protein